MKLNDFRLPPGADQRRASADDDQFNVSGLPEHSGEAVADRHVTKGAVEPTKKGLRVAKKIQKVSTKAPIKAQGVWRQLLRLEKDSMLLLLCAATGRGFCKRSLAKKQRKLPRAAPPHPEGPWSLR